MAPERPLGYLQRSSYREVGRTQEGIRATVNEVTGPSRDDALLVVEDVATHFSIPAGTVRAVDGVSFQLRPGETLGIVGESGSGKTVLARTIMRLNLGGNVHTSGNVYFSGRDLLSLWSQTCTGRDDPASGCGGTDAAAAATAE